MTNSIAALAARSTTARVLGHSGSTCNQPTWMILKPKASAILELAAYEVRSGKDILITATAPDAELKVKYHQGSLKIHHDKTAISSIKHLLCVTKAVTEVNPNIRAIKGTSTEQIRIAGVNNDAGVPDALLTAALLTETGHDIMLWTDGVVFEVRDLGVHVGA